jgi:DNA-binding transcriptional LysR family regulator
MADLRTLDLNLLKTFVALLDEGSVTRAAERLALTQPAVSGMLQRLRENFDDPLFVRTRRGITPTPRALALAEPLRRVLGEVDAMLKPPLFDPASAVFTLRLAATDYALRAVVTPFIAALRRQAPRVRVAVLPIDDARVLDQLERGELDIALTTPDMTPVGLHSRVLFEERYICALRHDHPDAAGPMTLERFCALDHALVSSGGSFSGVTDAALALLGRSRNVVLSVPGFLALPDVLRASDLVAVVPRRLVCAPEGLALLEPPLAIPGFSKNAVWHARSDSDPALRWARELLVATSAST